MVAIFSGSHWRSLWYGESKRKIRGNIYIFANGKETAKMRKIQCHETRSEWNERLNEWRENVEIYANIIQSTMCLSTTAE